MAGAAICQALGFVVFKVSNKHCIRQAPVGPGNPQDRCWTSAEGSHASDAVEHNRRWGSDAKLEGWRPHASETEDICVEITFKLLEDVLRVEICWVYGFGTFKIVVFLPSKI